MLIARLFGMLLLIVLGSVLLMYVVTKDRKWLRIFGGTLKVGAVILLIFLGVYLLERFLLVI